MTNAAIIIPSRIGSVRLINKAIAKIGDLTMIEHVILAAKKTGLDVYVATDDDKIAQKAALQKAEVIMTDPDCASGTDRVFAAMEIARLQHKVIVNLQGDMPFIDPAIIAEVAKMCLETDFDITTAVSMITSEYAQKISNVKAVLDKNNRALYFSRSLIPNNASTYFGHIGVYAFKRDSLRQFCNLPMAEIEQFEKLEQLRAMYNGMSIGACTVQTMPISVDTYDDLEMARQQASQL
jgi:3-deoxy-manno-octulosonate cytidylyltransferase (CMP-KDO synthetase)